MSLPNGVNLLNNTSAEFLGLVMAPVTLLFGPIGAGEYSRRHWPWPDLRSPCTSLFDASPVGARPAFVAGLLVGFGPYVLGQASDHPNLTCYVFPPIILLLVHDIATRRDGKMRRRGIILGLLIAAQFFVSSEVLAMTLVIAMVLLVVLAVRGRHASPVPVFSDSAGPVLAVAIAAVLLAYPAWYAWQGRVISTVTSRTRRCIGKTYLLPSFPIRSCASRCHRLSIRPIISPRVLARTAHTWASRSSLL